MTTEGHEFGTSQHYKRFCQESKSAPVYAPRVGRSVKKPLGRSDLAQILCCLHGEVTSIAMIPWGLHLGFRGFRVQTLKICFKHCHENASMVQSSL